MAKLNVTKSHFKFLVKLFVFPEKLEKTYLDYFQKMLKCYIKSLYVDILLQY